MIVDYVARYENFNAEMEYICKKISADYTAQRENITLGGPPSYVSQYTPDMMDIVAKIYQTDFKVFNYSTSLKLEMLK